MVQVPDGLYEMPMQTRLGRSPHLTISHYLLYNIKVRAFKK